MFDFKDLNRCVGTWNLNEYPLKVQFSEWDIEKNNESGKWNLFHKVLLMSGKYEEKVSLDAVLHKLSGGAFSERDVSFLDFMITRLISENPSSFNKIYRAVSELYNSEFFTSIEGMDLSDEEISFFDSENTEENYDFSEPVFDEGE